MQSFIYPRHLTGFRRAGVLTLAAVVFGVPTAVIRAGATGATTTTTTIPPPSSTLYCLDDPCYSPQQFQVAYGIQPLLERGIDGRRETVTAVVPVPVPSQGPTDIRQDLAAFDRMFHLPAAQRRCRDEPRSFSLAMAGNGGGDRRPRGSRTRFVAWRDPPGGAVPASWDDSPRRRLRTCSPRCRCVISHTDVASISWGLGSHYFTPAQVSEMHSILLGAQAHHVAGSRHSSGDNGVYPTDWGWGRAAGQRGSNFPSSDSLVLSVGGTQLSASPKSGAYIGETAWSRFGWRLQPLIRPSRLSRWRAGYLQVEGRARRGRRRCCARRYGAGLHLPWRRHTSSRNPARAVRRRSGRESWRWPTSTPIRT